MTIENPVGDTFEPAPAEAEPVRIEDAEPVPTAAADAPETAEVEDPGHAPAAVDEAGPVREIRTLAQIWAGFDTAAADVAWAFRKLARELDDDVKHAGEALDSIHARYNASHPRVAA